MPSRRDDWLRQAERDLDVARTTHRAEQYDWSCFAAQQAAEKALKAFLYAQGEELVVGHSVRLLCRRAAEHNARFQPSLDDWSVLDSYYIPTRYPNGLPDDIPARVYNRVARRVVQQKGYTWDVETDAMDWETAVGGMRTMERKIQELRESGHVQHKSSLPETQQRI